MSTEKTRAPSFARSAASGRPTTSDLRGCARGAAAERDGDVPVDDGDSAAVGAVAVRQERIVHADALEGFYDAQRCTGQDRLDGPWRWRVVLEWCGRVGERGRRREEGFGLEIPDAVWGGIAVRTVVSVSKWGCGEETDL